MFDYNYLKIKGLPGITKKIILMKNLATNSVDPAQPAPLGAVRIVSVLFAQTYQDVSGYNSLAQIGIS